MPDFETLLLVCYNQASILISLFLKICLKEIATISKCLEKTPAQPKFSSLLLILKNIMKYDYLSLLLIYIYIYIYIYKKP